MNLDSNIWGLLSVPVGVAFCFGPVLVTWMWQQRRGEKGRVLASRGGKQDSAGNTKR